MEIVKILAVIFLAIFLILFGIVDFLGHGSVIIHHLMNLLAFVSGVLFLLSIKHFHVCDKVDTRFVDKTKL